MIWFLVWENEIQHPAFVFCELFQLRPTWLCSGLLMVWIRDCQSNPAPQWLPLTEHVRVFRKYWTCFSMSRSIVRCNKLAKGNCSGSCIGSPSHLIPQQKINLWGNLCSPKMINSYGSNKKSKENSTQSLCGIHIKVGPLFQFSSHLGFQRASSTAVYLWKAAFTCGAPSACSERYRGWKQVPRSVRSFMVFPLHPVRSDSECKRPFLRAKAG